MITDLVHHSRMVGDRARLDAYESALRELIRPQDTVLDVGTGTGVLAALAAQLPASEVIAVEYRSDLCVIAESVLSRSALVPVTVLRGDARDADLAGRHPEVIVTETIGRLGPEEGMVGLLYGLAQQHPSARHLIPSNLEIRAEWLRTADADDLRERLLSPFVLVADRGVHYDGAFPLLDASFCEGTYSLNLTKSRCTSFGSKTVVSYELGQSKTGSFDRRLEGPRGDWDCVHVYFVATLSETVSFSTCRTERLTHWGHCVILRPGAARTLSLSYRDGAGNVTVEWQEPSGNNGTGKGEL